MGAFESVLTFPLGASKNEVSQVFVAGLHTGVGSHSHFDSLFRSGLIVLNTVIINRLVGEGTEIVGAPALRISPVSLDRLTVRLDRSCDPFLKVGWDR